MSTGGESVWEAEAGVPASDRDEGARRRGVLEGAFQLLDVLSRADGGAGLSELARDSGLPKATTYRLLKQLIELGAVHQIQRQLYVMGALIGRLGGTWQPYPALQNAAHGPTRTLSTLASAATCVTVLDHNRIRVVTATRGVVKEIPQLRPYDEFSASTAAGQVLLLTRQETHDGSPPGFTLSEWRRANTAFRRSGQLVVDRQGVVSGICCVAAPVRHANGDVAAAITALVVATTVPTRLIELVRRASREISHNLVRSHRSVDYGLA